MTTATATSAYEELRERCEPLLQNYHDDLVKHDRKAIEEHPDRAFLHWTRDSGTWLCWLWNTEDLPAKGVKVPYMFGTADRERISKGVVEIAKSCQHDNDREGKSYHKLVLHYDGKRFREIDCDQAVKIAQANHNRLLSEWKS